MNKQHDVTHHLAVQRAKADESLTLKSKHYSDGSEKLPSKLAGWRRSNRLDPGQMELHSAISISAWQRRGVFLISSLELAEAPDGRKDVIPQWHVSMSKPGLGRCSDVECQQALACFGLTGAEEDNHHPGVARHFWMPVDPKRRVDCECKSDETVHTDVDGYKWSQPVDACAGCDYEKMMAPQGLVAPCPIHKPGEKTDVRP